MSVRLEGTAAGKKGTTHTVQVIDTEFSGTATDVPLQGSGFTLAYKPNEERPDAEIFASELTFGIVRNATTAAAVDSFISDMQGADEGRFLVRVLNSDSSLNWIGYVMADQVRYEDIRWADAYSVYGISAKDGINRLKNIPYDDGGTNYEGRETFHAHLLKILGKIGLDAYWATDDRYLRAIVKWYEDTQSSPALTDNTLEEVYFDHFAVQEITKNNIIKPANTYDVLKTICTIFGARFFISNGSYHFHQFSEYRENGSITIHNYRKAGTKIGTTGSVNLDVDEEGTEDFITLSGSQVSFLAPIRQAELLFKHRNDRNYLLGKEWAAAGSTDVGLVGGTDISFRIAGNLTTDIAVTPDVPVRAIIGIRVRFTYSGTTYHLQREYAQTAAGISYQSQSWDDSGDVKYYKVVMPAQYGASGVSVNLDFITPEFPESEPDNVQMDVVFIGFIPASDSTEIISLDSISYDFTESLFQLYSDSEDALALESNFILQNSSAPNASEVLEKETALGDSPGFITSATITILNAGVQEPTNSWTKGLSGTGRNIQALLLKEIMEQRKATIRVFDADISLNSAVHVYNPIRLTDEERFIFLTGSYNSTEEVWSGQWTSIGYTDTITEVNPDKEVFGEVIGTGDFSGDGAAVEQAEASDPISNSHINGGQLVGTVSDTVQPGAGITNIPINPIGVGGLIQSGDIIALVNGTTGQTETVSVAADVQPTDTSISIGSTTLSNQYPSGSYLTLPVDTFVSNVSSANAPERYRQVFINPGSSTLTVTENGGTLPSDSVWLDVHYNGRLLAEGAGRDYTVSGSDVSLNFSPGGQAVYIVTFQIV